MTSFLRRMIGVAKLDVQIYEEVEVRCPQLRYHFLC